MKHEILKRVWRIIPVEYRGRLARVRNAWRQEFPMILNPTYADDGLISQHVIGFLEDESFINAYQCGKATGALKNHPGDIHFRAYVACWAAKYALALKGDFVECGVGMGLLSRTVVEYLKFNEVDKRLYLFDTYEGIPPSDAVSDNERVNINYLNNTHFHHQYEAAVRETFKDFANVKMIKGRVPDSFLGIELNSIAYISIDMNNAAAEIAAIEFLWPKLVSGGVVVLDDYAYGFEFIAQKQAWDLFAVRNNIEILTLPTGQGLIIKVI
jgi:hypothetical protein